MDMDCESSPSVDLNGPTSTLIAVLRADGHLCNVLTHVGAGNWGRIEAAVGAILAPRSKPSDIDEVARNVLQLICDDRGITGPIMKSVFFGTMDRVAGTYQAKRLRNKMKQLRKKIAAADFRLQEERERCISAEREFSVQSQVSDEESIADAPGEAGDRPGAAPSDQDLTASNIPAVEFGTDGIYVDAALIADGLGVDPASVPSGMRAGEIRAMCERGIDADTGLYRLTFFRPGHRVRLVIGPDGQVRQRSSIAFGKSAGVGQQLSVYTSGNRVCEQGKAL